MGQQGQFNDEVLAKLGQAQRRSDLAYQAIREAIVYQRIEPGTWLRLGTLAKELGVSQIAVREALNRLASEHLVEAEPYKGFRVRTLSSQDVLDLFDLRAVTIGLAVRVATNRISPAELAEMRALLPSTALGIEHLSVALDATQDFFWIAIVASGREHLIRVIEQIVSAVYFEPLLEHMTQQELDETARILQKWPSRIFEEMENKDGQQASKAVEGYYHDWLGLFRDVVSRMEG